MQELSENIYKLEEMGTAIEEMVMNQGKPLPDEELIMSEEFYLENPESKLHPTFSKEVEELLKDAVKTLAKAHVYCAGINAFMSGDCSEEWFVGNTQILLKLIANRQWNFG